MEEREPAARPGSGVTGRLVLTPEQAAKMLGIGRWKLYDLLRQGALPSIRIGSCRRIPAQAVEEFVAELLRQQSAPAPDLTSAS